MNEGVFHCGAAEDKLSRKANAERTLPDTKFCLRNPSYVLE